MISNTAQLVPTAPVIEDVDYSSGLKWKGNAVVNWDYRQWRLSWTALYFHSYKVGSSSGNNSAVILNQGDARIPSQIYHDLYGSYRFDAPSGVLSKLEVSVGVRNVFDKSPPLDLQNGFVYSPGAIRALSNFILAIKKSL